MLLNKIEHIAVADNAEGFAGIAPPGNKIQKMKNIK